MEKLTRIASQAVAVHADAPAENLFFRQYRRWMAGYTSRNVLCWDHAWDDLLHYVPQESEKALFNDFHLFTRTLIEQAARPIERWPDVCRCLCEDEGWIWSRII